MGDPTKDMKNVKGHILSNHCRGGGVGGRNMADLEFTSVGISQPEGTFL